MYPASLQKKIISYADAVSFRKKLTCKKLVFTNGCFDLVHVGHIQYLAQARELGDFLWLGLNSDDSVRGLKGEKRPIHSQQDRAILLAAFYFVMLFDPYNFLILNLANISRIVYGCFLPVCLA